MSNIQCCLPLSVMPLNILKYILKSKTAMNSSQKPWLLDYISGQLLITAICTSAVVKTTNCFVVMHASSLRVGSQCVVHHMVHGCKMN